jgi:hypothetical protein
MELATELQKIYDSEINVSIGWVWDGGINVRLGDANNGYLGQENLPSIADVGPWLQEAIARFYPDSTYAKSLDADVRERAKGRVFLPSQAGAQVRCPHCGTPHTAPPGMTGLFGFVCAHCGLPAAVELPKVQ